MKLDIGISKRKASIFFNMLVRVELLTYKNMSILNAWPKRLTMLENFIEVYDGIR